MNFEVILGLRCCGFEVILSCSIIHGRFGQKPHFDLIESNTRIGHACLESKDFYVGI